MSESQAETFTERVDVTTQPDGAFIGRLEIEVRPSDRHAERMRVLQDECAGTAQGPSPAITG
jgi:hypothetical protein